MGQERGASEQEQVESLVHFWIFENLLIGFVQVVGISGTGSYIWILRPDSNLQETLSFDLALPYIIAWSARPFWPRVGFLGT